MFLLATGLFRTVVVCGWTAGPHTRLAIESCSLAYCNAQYCSYWAGAWGSAPPKLDIIIYIESSKSCYLAIGVFGWLPGWISAQMVGQNLLILSKVWGYHTDYDYQRATSQPLTTSSQSFQWLVLSHFLYLLCDIVFAKSQVAMGQVTLNIRLSDERVSICTLFVVCVKHSCRARGLFY